MLQAAALLFLASTLLIGLVRPAVMLALLVCMFPAEQLMQATTPIFISTSWLFNVMCGVAAVATLSILALRQPESLRAAFTPTAVATFALFVFAAMSVLWTRNPLRAIDTVKNGAPYAVLLLVIAPLLLSDVAGLEKLGKATLLVGLAITGQLLVNPNLELYSSRFVLSLDAATHSNPLALGTMGGLILVVGVVANFGRSNFWNLTRLTAVFAGLGIALLSGSRGQVLGAGIVCVLVYPLSRQIKDYRRFLGLLIGFAVMIGIAMLALDTFVGSANEERWGSESLMTGGSGRVDNAVDLLTEWIKSPASYLIGLGYFAFEVLPSRSGDAYSHVMMADSLGELGLIGITLYSTVYVLALRDGFRSLARYRDDPRGRSMIAMLMALLMYSFLLQNKQGTLYGLDPGWVFAILLSRINRLSETALAEADVVDEHYYEETDDAVGDYRDGPLPIASHGSS